MQDVANWFKTEVYDEGVKLYLKYGTNAALKNMFREEQTDFKRKKLAQALQEILNSSEKPTTREEIISEKVKSNPLLAFKGWPNPISDIVVKQLHEKWRPLYQELMNIQARVYEVALLGQQGFPGKDIEACQMAHRILDLDDMCEEIYAERDYYLQYGKLPENKAKEVEVVGDPVRWVTELENAKRYVRRYRTKIENNPGHPSTVKWAQLVKDNEEKVAHYKKLLKLDQ